MTTMPQQTTPSAAALLWLCTLLLMVCGCASRADAETTYKELQALPSDAERQTYVIRLRPGLYGKASQEQLRGMIQYFRDHPQASGALQLGILFTLTDYRYADSEFCDWLMRERGLSKHRDERSDAWFYLAQDEIRYRVPEDVLKEALVLAHSEPGSDIDGTTLPPDKDCIGNIRGLGRLHYPDSNWWRAD